jgi:phosphoribosylformylglycinamidine (FGAM) synthase-like enzyme
MRPKFRTPDEIARSEQKERMSVLVSKEYYDCIKKIATQKKITVSAIVNAAIRAYCEFIEESKKAP